jgi:hypothetical protein
VGLYIRDGNNGANLASTTDFIIPANSTLEISNTTTPPVSLALVIAVVYPKSNATDGVIDIEVRDIQCEAKTYATRFTVGTRSPVVVTDYSGNGNNGTIALATTPNWISDGVDGGAYEFDGVATKFIKSGSVSLTPTSWTISMWAMKEAHTVSSYPIFLSFGLPYIACSSSGSPFRLSYTAGSQVNASGTTIPVLN